MIYFICATLGDRLDELNRMINSITSQLNLYTIYLVHQGLINRREIMEYECSNINVISLAEKGLSLSRNVALKKIYKSISKDDIICFPDDDCYYPVGFFRLLSTYLENSDYFICQYGELINLNKILIKKNFSKKFIFRAPSVGIFFKFKEEIYFDEKLGLGTNTYSCEDADFVENLRNISKSNIFTNNKLVWHKEISSIFIAEKYLNAIIGVGYFTAKCISKGNYKYISLIAIFMTKQIFGIVLSKKGSRFHINSIKHFIKGYHMYESNTNFM